MRDRLAARWRKTWLAENNDITIVDINPSPLRQLQDKFDLRTIQGHASHPRVLREAGAEDADMLVAVTNSDETNMVACQIAYTLFKTPNRIARIRSADYIRESARLFSTDVVPIDHLISPEQLVIESIYKLVEYPGALQVVNFCEGKVSIAAVKAYYGGPLVGNALSSCANICRISIPALPRYFAMIGLYVPRALP